MAIPLEQSLFSFLDHQMDKSRPLLLGLSGGADSLSLFYLLLKYQEIASIQFGVAHVDHGWRAESQEEARQLEQLAAEKGVPFHLKKLDPTLLKGNLEASCREERLSFFSSLCRQWGYQSVILGHHASDQAETVLKRLLEGASLFSLGALQENSIIEGLSIWRPLLPFKKREIQQWVKERGLSPFEDQTNFDPKYLRGKFRTRILPLIKEEFGKEIEGSFEKIGKEAQELTHYLNQRVSSELASIKINQRGLFLDLSQKPQLHPFEIKYLIKKICEYSKICLSRASIEWAVDAILKGLADKQLIAGSKEILIDRGRLFVLYNHQKLEPQPPFLPLKQGAFNYGAWSVTVDLYSNSHDPVSCSNWRNIWQGFAEVLFPLQEPLQNYQLGPPHLNACYPGNSPLHKWWTKAKVPAFIRNWAPVIWKKGEIQREFLTGRQQKKSEDSNGWVHLVLQELKDPVEPECRI